MLEVVLSRHCQNFFTNTVADPGFRILPIFTRNCMKKMDLGASSSDPPIECVEYVSQATATRQGKTPLKLINRQIDLSVFMIPIVSCSYNIVQGLSIILWKEFTKSEKLIWYQILNQQSNLARFPSSTCDSASS